MLATLGAVVAELSTGAIFVSMDRTHALASPFVYAALVPSRGSYIYSSRDSSASLAPVERRTLQPHR